MIEADMEGISGIVLPKQVSAGDKAYETATRFLTMDVNACIEGCFRGGAKEVVVWDAHGLGHNMPWDAIDERAELIQGQSTLGRLHDIADYDGLILLGAHAMAGTSAAILEHTMSSTGWQNCWLNGRKAGEIAIDAGIAGDDGVPTIMVSGDDKACAEARRWIKGVFTAVVKKGYSNRGGRLLGRKAAHKLIVETAENACRNCRKVKPLVHSHPVRLRVELVERVPLPGAIYGRKGVTFIDARTFEVAGATTREAFSSLCL